MTSHSSSRSGRYRERLFAPLTWWLLLLGFAVSIWFVFEHAYGSRVSIPAALGVYAVGGVVIVLYGRPRIAVADGYLVAGVARLPLTAVGTVEALHDDAARTARGRDLSPVAYCLIRGYIAPVIRIEVADDQDPTPYWLLSSRRPEQLLTVIGAAREEAGNS